MTPPAPFEYMEADIPPGMTCAEYRRSLAHIEHRSGLHDAGGHLVRTGNQPKDEGPPRQGSRSQ